MNRIVRTAVTLVFTALAGLALAQPVVPKKIDAEAKQKVLAEMEEVLTKVAFVPGADFERWPDLVSEYKEEIDAAENTDQFAFVVNTALQQFGFSHILLFSPTAAERRATNKMVGIGVRIEIEEGGIRVVRVYEDGAAAAAGLKIGDLIVEADGKPVRQPGDLAGEEGQPVKLKIDRSGVVIERELVRKTFNITLPEELTFPEKDTAMITVPSFDQTYSAERVQDLMAKAEQAKHLIVDLRGNGGGRVINLLHFSSFLLTRDQPLGTFIDRNTVEKYKDENNTQQADLLQVAEWTTTKLRPLRRTKEPFKGEIAVLVDAGTGSASEMIAAALKEQRDATIIGSQSAGAVLASTMRPLEGGFLLQYPLMDYVTIKGRRLEGNGVVPDIVAPTPRFGAPDVGIQEALRVLKAKKEKDGEKAAA